MRSIIRGLVLLICLAPWCGIHAEPPGAGTPGPVRLVLPPVIPVVVGQETNVYFDNVVLVPNPANYIFDVSCLRGQQLSDHWTWVPAAADVGDIAWQLDVRDAENQLIASGQSVLRIVAANQREGVELTVLCVGDSLTHASVYTQQLLDRSAQPGNPKITLIGSHFVGDSGPNRHEGYGGWTARRFATHYSEIARTGEYSQRGSPFLYPSSSGPPTLDFSRYCQDVNAGKFPEIVTIFLGPNDLYPYTDEVIDAQVDDVLANLDLLIQMVHVASAKTQVAVMLPVPPCSSQDAFGANYGSHQTRWQYKRNIHRMVERLQSQYSQRPGVHLVPTNIALDCVSNYPSHTVKANAASEVLVTRQNNGVHPNTAGYVQIGNTLFDWIKGQ